MKRRILYRIGKIAHHVGALMQRPWSKLEWWGRELWDLNCDCAKCQERNRVNAAVAARGGKTA